MTDVDARAGLGYLEFDGVAISIGPREFDPGFETVTKDSTSGADTLETEAKIREKIMPKLKLLIDDSATGAAILAVLYQGNTGNLIWGEEGNTTGKPKWGISAQVKKANIAMKHDDLQVLDVEFANIGRDLLYDGRSATF